ncbi:transmembrane and immunoglobulin domain-containing protein 1 [Synchiropus picturatus]
MDSTLEKKLQTRPAERRSDQGWTVVEIRSVPAIDGRGVIQTEANSTVSLLCVVDAPLAELVWLRNGATVKLQEANRFGNSSVCVSPVTASDDGAVFSCATRQDAATKNSVTLNVTYPPPLSAPEQVTVEEETALALSCGVQANPPVSSVKWSINGSAVDLVESGFSVSSDGVTSVLSTAVAQRSLHAGTYQCLATSPIYGTRTKSFQVTVADRSTFPLMPIIAGVVVICLTAVLAVLSRWHKIAQCCK